MMASKQSICASQQGAMGMGVEGMCAAQITRVNIWNAKSPETALKETVDPLGFETGNAPRLVLVLCGNSTCRHQKSVLSTRQLVVHSK